MVSIRMRDPKYVMALRMTPPFHGVYPSGAN
jgi:hypothetical protein